MAGEWEKRFDIKHYESRLAVWGQWRYTFFTFPALVGAIVWIRSLGMGFLNDDFIFVFFSKNATLWDYLHNFHALKGGIFCRPVAQIPWGLDLALWGTAPWGYHLTNLLLHSINSALAGWLAFRLTFNRRKAVAAGVLFASYPLSVEAVCWLSGRSDLLCAAFFLLSPISFLRYRENRARKAWYAISLAAFVPALLSKETAFVLPAVIMVADLVLPDGGKSRLKLHAPYWAIVTGYVVYRTLSLGGLGLMGYKPHCFSVIHVLRAVPMTLFAPLNLHVAGTAFAITFLLASIAIFAFAAVRAGKSEVFSPATIVAAVLFVLPLVIVAHLLPAGTDLQKARFFYLPTAGLALFVATILFPSGKRARPGYLLLLVILIGYAAGARVNMKPYERARRIADGIVSQTISICSDIPRGGKVYYLDLPDNIDGAYIFRNGITFALALGMDARVHNAGFHASVPQLEAQLPLTAWRLGEGGDAGIEPTTAQLRRILASGNNRLLRYNANTESLERITCGGLDTTVMR